MTKNFNEAWGFDFGKEIKTYGLTEKQVHDCLDTEATKDFDKALAGVPDEDRAWAAKQAAYHEAATFWRLHDEGTSKKLDNGTYWTTKLAILQAAGVV